jgi:multidrug efflux pump subunit AcrB
MEDEGMDRLQATKKELAKIAMPIIISTLTTVAAFVPLGLWPELWDNLWFIFP